MHYSRNLRAIYNVQTRDIAQYRMLKKICETVYGIHGKVCLVFMILCKVRFVRGSVHIPVGIKMP
jgi:hypothetical protein